jgi:hypothetical protein
MRPQIKLRALSALLPAWIGLFLVTPAQASEPHVNDGNVILRMCQSADKVKMLSVMCLSYLNGYIDAAHHYGKGKAAFCLETDDKQKAPGVLVAWIHAHPESLSQPAAEVMQHALTEQFPCKAGKQHAR